MFLTMSACSSSWKRCLWGVFTKIILTTSERPSFLDVSKRCKTFYKYRNTVRKSEWFVTFSHQILKEQKYKYGVVHKKKLKYWHGVRLQAKQHSTVNKESACHRTSFNKSKIYIVCVKRHREVCLHAIMSAYYYILLLSSLSFNLKYLHF